MVLRPVAAVAVVTASLSLAAPSAHAAAATNGDGSLRAHWGLDETSGTTAFDSSGNDNDGTAFNVTQDGSGYVFNGVDSRVIVPSSGILNPGSADFSFGGAPVRMATAFAGLSPMMGLTHVVAGVGDTVTIGVPAAESALGGPDGMDAYVAGLEAALSAG